MNIELSMKMGTKGHIKSDPEILDFIIKLSRKKMKIKFSGAMMIAFCAASGPILETNVTSGPSNETTIEPITGATAEPWFTTGSTLNLTTGPTTGPTTKPTTGPTTTGSTTGTTPTQTTTPKNPETTGTSDSNAIKVFSSLLICIFFLL